MGTYDGAMRTAAKRIGLTLEEYRFRRAAGLKYCWACKLWLPESDYGTDMCRSDFLTPTCRGCKNRRARELHYTGKKVDRQYA